MHIKNKLIVWIIMSPMWAASLLSELMTLQSKAASLGGSSHRLVMCASLMYY